VSISLCLRVRDITAIVIGQKQLAVSLETSSTLLW